jgi:lysozyme
MNGQAFDELARAHADGLSRRQVIKMALAGAIGLYAGGFRRPFSTEFGFAEMFSPQRAHASGACANDFCYKTKSKPMTISQKGLQFLRREEGFCGKLYDDGAAKLCGRGRGNCTVGIGHLVHHEPCDGRGSEKPFLKGLTEQEAYDLLLKVDVPKHAVFVDNEVLVELGQEQYDVLVSFTFNAGPKGLRRWILPYLNCGDYDAIPKQLELSGQHKIPTIQRRRRREAAMWQTGIHNKTCPSCTECEHKTGECHDQCGNCGCVNGKCVTNTAVEDCCCPPNTTCCWSGGNGCSQCVADPMLCDDCVTAQFVCGPNGSRGFCRTA